jgi:ferredoxin
MSVGVCMKNVTVEPGCISCGSCQFIVPEVFQVTDTSHVKEGVDIAKFESLIKEAAAKCPVQVIKIKE